MIKLDKIKKITKTINNKYEKNVRKRAIKEVSKKLKSLNLSPSEVDIKDYESMVSDAIKDIKLKDAKTTAKAGLSILGFNLIFGA